MILDRKTGKPFREEGREESFMQKCDISKESDK